MNNTLPDTHLCEWIENYQNDDDLFTSVKNFNGNWVLHIFHYACDHCVKDGEAQYEGELLSVYDVAINYCPYCGMQLNEKLSTSVSQTEETTEIGGHCCAAINDYNRNNPRVGFSFDTEAIWKIVKDPDYWYLSRHSVATERMVLAKEADDGELVYWHGTSIFFCPFCGINLSNK